MAADAISVTATGQSPMNHQLAANGHHAGTSPTTNHAHHSASAGHHPGTDGRTTQMMPVNRTQVVTSVENTMRVQVCTLSAAAFLARTSTGRIRRSAHSYCCDSTARP